MANIGIIGAGSWGIALAVLLHKNGHKITVWSILQDEIAMLEKEHEHKDKLPGVKLPKDMVFTTDLEGAVKGKDVLPKLRVQGGLHPGHVLPGLPDPLLRSRKAELYRIVQQKDGVAFL